MSTAVPRPMRQPFPFRLSWPAPDRPEVKALLTLAAPMTGAALVGMGMSITDTLMMGWIGPTALAAGAVVSDLYSLVFYLAAGTLSIVAVLAARAVGAGEPEGVRRAVRAGFAAALLLLAPGVAAVWHAADFVRMLGVDPAVPELGRGYARAMAITLVPMLFVTVWRNLFGALGRPRVFLLALAAALPLNALANLVLMFGWGPVPALGVTGAGIASALVAFALLIGFAAFTFLDPELRRLRLFRAPWHVAFGDVREVFRLGLPIGVFTLGEVGLFLIATVVVSLFGAEALAAHAIALRMAGIVYAIPTGLSQAATVRVGTALGTGERERVDCAVSSTMTVCVISGVLICAALAAGSDVIPRLFIPDSGTFATASALLLLLGVLHLAQSFAGPATAILRAHKDTRIPTQLSLAGYWAVGMPVGALLGFGLDLGVFGIWCGLGVGVFASALLLNLRLLRSVLRPEPTADIGRLALT
jgi:MATE family multidrug resistance protein